MHNQMKIAQNRMKRAHNKMKRANKAVHERSILIHGIRANYSVISRGVARVPQV